MTCQELCQKILNRWPTEHFTVVDMSNCLNIQYNCEFSNSTITKALHALWKNQECEALLDPLLYYKRTETPEEQRARAESVYPPWTNKSSDET